MACSPKKDTEVKETTTKEEIEIFENPEVNSLEDAMSLPKEENTDGDNVKFIGAKHLLENGSFEWFE